MTNYNLPTETGTVYDFAQLFYIFGTVLRIFFGSRYTFIVIASVMFSIDD